MVSKLCIKISVLQRTAGKGIFSNTELFCFFQTSREAAAKCCGLIVSHPLHGKNMC
jgi:hypothetical protein